MLHAFDAATGAESWAFIPPSVLTSLKTMKSRWDQYKLTGSAGEHLYYVDGSPRVSDVWFYSSASDTTKEANEWKTVLICGLRKGGKTYFALDVTHTTDPVYLWEFPKSTDTTTLNKMGQSWSDPAIGRIRIEVDSQLVERWVAFIGGGYMSNTDASEGRYVFVVDIKTGDILKEFSGFSAPIAAPVTVVDTDSDGFLDRFYVGDEEGRMYAGYVGDKDPANWTQATLSVSPGAESGKHPFHYPAAVAFDGKETVWVYAGTGPREDPTSNTVERFYAVKDNGRGPYPRGVSDLVDVTQNPGTFTPVPDNKYGWTIKLANKEKVFGKAAVFNRLVYFTTYSPREGDSDPCTTGGTARLYVAEFLSGGGALEIDDMGDLAGNTTARSKVIGSGVPSAPIITIDAHGQASIIIGTTENQVYSQKGFSPDSVKNMLYWREILY
jgi:type IV pilus assembly protein PilY1